MALTCLACGTHSLEQVVGIELGPDGTNDENTLKTISCTHCTFVGVAVYRESRRGSGERWEHFGCGTTLAVFAEVTRALRCCPRPHDHHCDCAAHRRFGARDAMGTITATDSIVILDPRGDLE